jgi:hypothetical protein
MFVVRAVMRLLPLSILHELKEPCVATLMCALHFEHLRFILHFHTALAGIRNKRRANAVP